MTHSNDVLTVAMISRLIDIIWINMIQFSFHQNINGGHGQTDQLLSAYYPAPFLHQRSGHCLAWCVAGQDWKPRLWWYSWDNNELNELKPCMSPCPVETLVISIPISAYWRVPVYSLFMFSIRINPQAILHSSSCSSCAGQPRLRWCLL